MQGKTTMPELYTIGYEGIAQDALFHALLRHDVQTLWTSARCRRAASRACPRRRSASPPRATDFSTPTSAPSGTPRDVRYRRKMDHDAAAFREGYLAHLAGQDEAMQALVARAQEERCCLMCYEADARECHRWFVAERAVDLERRCAHCRASGGDGRIGATAVSGRDGRSGWRLP